MHWYYIQQQCRYAMPCRVCALESSYYPARMRARGKAISFVCLSVVIVIVVVVVVVTTKIARSGDIGI